MGQRYELVLSGLYLLSCRKNGQAFSPKNINFDAYSQLIVKALIMENITQIKCPKCGTPIDVENIVAHQVEEKLRLEFNSKYKEEKQKLIDNAEREKRLFEEKEEAFKKKEEALKTAEKNLETQVEERLKIESVKRTREIEAKVFGDFEVKIKASENELKEKNEKLAELKNAAIENESLKRKLMEQEDDLKIKFQKELTQKLVEEVDNFKRKEGTEHEMKMKEKEETIKQLLVQMEEMKRTGQQSSMQLQGEVQELVIENMLRELFPHDDILEVAKGVRGADVMQIVRNRLGAECGKILYESKRTKKFNEEWIDKLKGDALSCNADVCIIVTEALPDGIDKFNQVKGVWVTSFYDLKSLIIVLRDSLIKIGAAINSQVNKGEKMQMLYDYVGSPEFRHRLDFISSAFLALKQSIDKEKGQMQKLWGEREKNINIITENLNLFDGSLRAITGPLVEEVKEHTISI